MNPFLPILICVEKNKLCVWFFFATSVRQHQLRRTCWQFAHRLKENPTLKTTTEQVEPTDVWKGGFNADESKVIQKICIHLSSLEESTWKHSQVEAIFIWVQISWRYLHVCKQHALTLLCQPNIVQERMEKTKTLFTSGASNQSENGRCYSGVSAKRKGMGRHRPLLGSHPLLPMYRPSILFSLSIQGRVLTQFS